MMNGVNEMNAANLEAERMERKWHGEPVRETSTATIPLRVRSLAVAYHKNRCSATYPLMCLKGS